MSHDHDHENGQSYTEPPSEIELRVKALESLLIEKKVVDADGIDALLGTIQEKIGPKNGAAVVARAWTDKSFRSRLLADGTQAVAELGYAGFGAEHLVVVANSISVHNMIVCTLCSCYPWAILGAPPTWYKSAAYRSRAVIDPRGLLREFGVSVSESTEVRVWDANSEIRYMVLPQRPCGTDGWDEESLRGLVTRDSMIGVGLPALPGAGPGTRGA